MEEDQIMEIWDLFVEHLPWKERELAASKYLEYLLDRDTDKSTLESLIGNDEFLDTAIEEYLEGSADEDYFGDD